METIGTIGIERGYMGIILCSLVAMYDSLLFILLACSEHERLTRGFFAWQMWALGLSIT